jgi:hypothetical protein
MIYYSPFTCRKRCSPVWLSDITSFLKFDGWRHDLYSSGAAPQTEKCSLYIRLFVIYFILFFFVMGHNWLTQLVALSIFSTFWFVLVGNWNVNPLGSSHVPLFVKRDVPLPSLWMWMWMLFVWTSTQEYSLDSIWALAAFEFSLNVPSRLGEPVSHYSSSEYALPLALVCLGFANVLWWHAMLKDSRKILLHYEGSRLWSTVG